MSSALRTRPRVNRNDFLAFIDSLPGQRWELVGGTPRLMVGGTRAHARICANLLFAVRPAARARGCDAYGSFFVEAPDGSMLEPDLLVECPGGRSEDRSTDNPVVIVEVLSPSTMHYDRSQKAVLYRDIASLRQLIFVYQDSVRVESWSRDDEGIWASEATFLLSRTDILPVPALETSLRLADIYVDVRPTPFED